MSEAASQMSLCSFPIASLVGLYLRHLKRRVALLFGRTQNRKIRGWLTPAHLREPVSIKAWNRTDFYCQHSFFLTHFVTVVNYIKRSSLRYGEKSALRLCYQLDISFAVMIVSLNRKVSVSSTRGRNVSICCISCLFKFCAKRAHHFTTAIEPHP